MEVRELLNKYSFPGDTTPIIRGQSKAALENPKDDKICTPIDDLFEAIDTFIPEPTREEKALPSLCRRRGRVLDQGSCSVATSRIERGDVVESATAADRRSASQQDLGHHRRRNVPEDPRQRRGRRQCRRAAPWYRRTTSERGQVICKPGSIKPHAKFKGQVYVLTKEEGGRHTPFFSNYRPQFYFRTTDDGQHQAPRRLRRNVHAGQQHRVEDRPG